MIAKLRQAFESLPLLMGMSVFMATVTAVAVPPAADYVIARSISIERNFYILGGIMLLVMLASSVQALLAIRLIWGARSVWGYRPSQAGDGDEENDLQEMRALKEIFAEVVSENQIVAPTAIIYDDAGDVAVRFADGLPAKVSFRMPPTSNAFELEVGGRRIRQTLLSRKS